MGVLIDGVWRDEELPQEVGRAGEFLAPRASFAIASRPMAPPVSRPSLAATTSMSRMAARGRTAL